MNTWISLTDRPPPVSRLEVASKRKLLCLFLLEHAPEHEKMGYYLGGGQVHFVGDNPLQPSLLNLVTHWRPFSLEGLREYERNNA